jgi:two-component system, OmpR family, alkaline phosphatase synthesis response regulator PhoP
MTEARYKVLVVDDEPFMIRLLEILLERDGHEVIRASNGTQAVEVARLEQPMVIIMDGMMPGMDGLTALRLLKETPETSQIPVIMLTANPNRFSPQEAAASGAAWFLTKPFSPSELLGEIRRIRRVQGESGSEQPGAGR